MYAEAVVAELPAQLAHSLEIWQRLDVAYGTADFCDDEIVVACVAKEFDVALDFVGDVRHYLYGLAQIVAAALLVDDGLIYSACSDIVGARSADVGETLVMAQIEVGLVSVFGDVTFTVLVRIERTRVDVDIRVKFLYRHAKPSCLEQTCQRR